MGKTKARRKALEKKRGTTANDPFIPARNARPFASGLEATKMSTPTLSTGSATTNSRGLHHRWRIAMPIALIVICLLGLMAPESLAELVASIPLPLLPGLASLLRNGYLFLFIMGVGVFWLLRLIRVERAGSQAIAD